MTFTIINFWTIGYASSFIKPISANILFYLVEPTTY